MFSVDSQLCFWNKFPSIYRNLKKEEKNKIKKFNVVLQGNTNKYLKENNMVI